MQVLKAHLGGLLLVEAVVEHPQHQALILAGRLLWHFQVIQPVVQQLLGVNMEKAAELLVDLVVHVPVVLDQPGPLLQTEERARAVALVKVIQAQIVGLQEVGQGQLFARVLRKSLYPLGQAQLVGGVLLQVVKNVALGFRLQLQVAGGWQVGEVIADLPAQGPAWASQGPELGLVAVMAVGLADKVQDRQAVLARAEPQAPAQLLEEDCRALGWPQEEDGIDAGDVHPFVVQVHDKNKLELARGQVAFGLVAVGLAALSGQGRGLDAGLVEAGGHEFGVLDADAKAQSLDLAQVIAVALDVLEDQLGPGIVSGIDVFQLADLILAPAPLELGVVDAVGDSKILKGAEQLAAAWWNSSTMMKS